MNRNKTLSTLVILFISFLSAYQMKAQTLYNVNKSVDYRKNNNLTVDPISQALQFSIPFGVYQGRNSTIPVSLDYSSKLWSFFDNVSTITCNGASQDQMNRYSARYDNQAGWRKELFGNYENANQEYYNAQAQQSNTGITSTIARIYVRLRDGSKHELRKNDNVYTGLVSNIGGKYYAVDDSKLVYDKDTNILYLPDGSTRQAGINTDKDGNKIVTDNVQVVDTLARVLNDPISVPVGDQSNATSTTYTYTLPSLNGNGLSYLLHWKKLSDPGVLSEHETDQTLKYEGNATGGCMPVTEQINSLFASYEGDYPAGNLILKTTTIVNPVVLNRIDLPNGQSYIFKYNVYGEITKIIYPSGAYERFQYAPVAGIGGVFEDDFINQVNRGVIKRWISYDGSSQNEVQYSYNAPFSTVPNEGIREIINPDGSKTVLTYFRRVDGERIAYGFDNPLNGKVKEEKFYDTNGQLVRRKIYEWTVEGSVVPGPSGTKAYKMRNPKIVREINIEFSPGAALASLSETVYDSHPDPAYFATLNPKQVKNYHYIPVDLNTAQNGSINILAGMFGAGNLANIFETDYLYDASYKARNLLTLPVETRLKDAAGNLRSRSQIAYDEAAYPILSVGTDSQWTDPQTPVRGNPTTIRSWTDLAANQYAETHAQYDNFGNLRKAWDARGVLSETDYDAAYRFAYPVAARTAAADPSGQRGSSTPFQTTTAYDFTTGLPLSVTDANGQTTQMQYNDALLRPTRVIPPSGGAITETVYNDTPGNLWVKTRTQIDANNWKEAITYLDGLGRTRATQSIDNQGDVFTETQYDNMGRVKQTTNPYRKGETKLWTQTNYDAAGRPYQVVTPDGATVQTSYELATSGNVGTVVTVTDQAGKQRRSITNALGQLVRVDEPDDNGNLGAVSSPAQPTAYTYDALNNLIQVNQGVQQRNFAYDSLSRLRQATNPESGAINYNYDANGNLTQKTDARNVTTTYVYDNLNRVITRSYSDGTPQVVYTYDNLQNARGKLIQVTSAISTTNYSQFDTLGRVLQSQQLTDGSTFNFSYQYNLAGMLTQQTYPSGRTVTNGFETDGDLAQVTGSFQSVGKVYAGGFNYTSAGAVSSMQLGNGRWENTVFNSRLQPVQIGLGSSATAQDLWKVNYDYGSTDNNGNVKSQQITVPNQFVANQVYTYDTLNRLKSATETISGGQTWKQTYQFDRYGNRNFDASQTTTLGNCPPAVCNPAISQSNNRVQTHQYDNAGNTTIDAEGRSFYYDGESKQKEVRDTSNNIIGQYLYDGDGKRVKKVAANDTTIFVYDAGGKLASEYTQSASQSQAPQTSYLTNDTLGSPRVTTDQAGNVISRRDFRPYGEEIYRPNQGGDSIREKFATYERDNETSLDFAQARMYGFSTGRFTSPDPYSIVMESKAEKDKSEEINKLNKYLNQPQQWNRYVYVANNPLKYADPSGETLELTGSQKNRQKALDRIRDLVGEEASKNLYIYETEDGRTFVKYFDYQGGLSKGAGEIGKVVEDMINSDTNVELQITQEATITWSDGKTENISNRGALTQHMSPKSIQIFINDTVSMKVLADSAVVAGVETEDGSKLSITESLQLAHEFGHAWGGIKDNFNERYNKVYSFSLPARILIRENNNRSLQVENWQRDRLGLPHRKNH